MKENIKSINEIIGKMIENNENAKKINLKIQELISPYFIKPLDKKYIIGIAESGINNNSIFNLGYCGLKTHTYVLQLYKNSCFDGYMYSGTINLFGNNILHHWVEIANDVIFDGLFVKFFNKKDYYKLFKIKKNNIYKTPLKEKSEIIQVINAGIKSIPIQLQNTDKILQNEILNALGEFKIVYQLLYSKWHYIFSK